MKPLKTKVSITLDSDVLDLIKELAEQDDRSLSQYISIHQLNYKRTFKGS